MVRAKPPPGKVQYDLARLATDHPDLWTDAIVLAFAARRGGIPGASSTIAVASRSATAAGQRLQVDWSFVIPASLPPDEISRFARTYQGKTITEYAALAVAAAQVAYDLGLQFKETTQSGDRGDYWLKTADGADAGMCEVSGTTAHAIESLFTEKRSQILRNRGVATCFVSVTNFTSTEGRFCRVR